MFESGKIYECLNGRRVLLSPHGEGWQGKAMDEPPDSWPVYYDGFGHPTTAADWKAEWGIRFEDGHPVEASDWKCPHCGSTKGTWFDRSFYHDAGGNLISGPGYICSDCARNVDETKEDAPSQRQVEDDGVTAPGYYTIGGIEALDVIKAKLTKEEFRGFLKGSILKYIMRANYKNQHNKDCRKTAFYANRLEQEVEDNGGLL